MKNNFMKIKTFKIFILIFAVLFSGFSLPGSVAVAATCDSTASAQISAGYAITAGQAFVIDLQADYITYEPTGGRNFYSLALLRNGVVIREWTADTNYMEQAPDFRQYYVTNGISADTEFSAVATVTSDISCPGGASDTDTMIMTISTIEAPPVCVINSFNPLSSSIAYNTSTNLNFSLSGAFDWDIDFTGGTVAPTPRTGTTASGAGTASTGNLTATQSYTLNCYYKNTSGQTQKTSMGPRTVTVTAPGSPPAEYCTDPAANNYGGALPCDYTPIVVGNLCSPMANGAGVRNNYTGTGCTEIENQVKASEAECLTWCNANNADGCEYGSGKCYRSNGSGCYVEYGYPGWKASVDECPTPPPYLTPTITPSVSCVPVGQTSYTATISWAPTVANNILIFLDDNFDTPEGFNKTVYGTPGSTPAPSGFTQRIPGGPAVLTLLPGVTYKSFIQNMSENSGPTASRNVPQCALTNTATGNLGTGNCTSFSGWAWDPDRPDFSTTVDIYKDGALYASNVAAVSADASFPGANKNKGFTYTTPAAWKDGANHTISIYADDLTADTCAGGGIECFKLVGSPQTIRCEVGMSGDLTGPGSCEIPLNGSSCSPAYSLGWEMINPIGASTTLKGNGGMTDRTLSTPNSSLTYSGTETVTIPYSGRTFELWNNSTRLVSKTVTANCKSTDKWSEDQQKCITKPPVGSCGNNIVEPQFDEECDPGQANLGTCSQNKSCSTSCKENDCPPIIHPYCDAPNKDCLQGTKSEYTLDATGYNWKCTIASPFEEVKCHLPPDGGGSGGTKPIYIEN